MPGRKRRAIAQPGAAPASPPAPRAPSSRAAWLSALAVFIVLLAVYQATMLRTVVDIDSGELVAAVHVQGIPHPTGYPLWLLLGRLFDYLPLGHSSAYRVGMMSATGVAATGALITLVAVGMTGQVIPALAAGIAFGLWSPPWGDSVRAMVHAITGLFVTLCIIALRRWQRERSMRDLWLLSLAFGVAVMHHRTSVLAVGFAFLAAYLLTSRQRAAALLALGWLVAVALSAYTGRAGASLAMLAVFVVLSAVALVRWRGLATHLVSVALVLAPFSLYLYLWWRSLQHPPVYWSSLDTFGRLSYHLFAKHYSGFAFQHLGIRAFEEAGKTLGQLLVPDPALAALLFLITVPLMLSGWWEWRRREPLAAASLGAGVVLLTIWVMHWGESSDLKHFLTPAGPALALSGALGMARWCARWRAVPGRAWVPAAVLSAIICGMLFSGNYPLYDFSNRWANRDRWVAALQQMDRNAVFVSDFDQPSYVGMYLQNVEGLRRDITILRATRLSDPGYVELIADSEVRKAVEQVGSPPGFASEEASHEWAAFFSHQLAQRLRGRTVHGVHGPIRSPLTRPPYCVNLSEDLVRWQFEQPRAISRPSTSADLVQFQNGAALVGFALDRAAAATGEMVGFTVRWRVFQQLPPSQFGVALIPPGMELSDLTSETLRDTRFIEGFFCLSGLWGTPASAEGTCYEQRGMTIIPSNAPPGEYRVFIGLGHLYAESYIGWTEVGRLRVAARPLPRNGP